MKRSKLFMAGGTLILAVSAIFATKANKKFSGITTAKIGATGLVLHAASTSLLTTTATGVQAKVQMYTGNHNNIAEGSLFTDVSGSKQVYYK